MKRLGFLLVSFLLLSLVLRADNSGEFLTGVKYDLLEDSWELGTIGSVMFENFIADDWLLGGRGIFYEYVRLEGEAKYGGGFLEAYLKYLREPLSVDIGKIAPRWGKGTFLNAMDVFAFKAPIGFSVAVCERLGGYGVNITGYVDESTRFDAVAEFLPRPTGAGEFILGVKVEEETLGGSDVGAGLLKLSEGLFWGMETTTFLEELGLHVRSSMLLGALNRRVRASFGVDKYFPKAVAILEAMLDTDKDCSCGFSLFAGGSTWGIAVGRAELTINVGLSYESETGTVAGALQGKFKLPAGYYMALGGSASNKVGMLLGMGISVPF